MFLFFSLSLLLLEFSTEKLQKGITDIPIFSIDAETPIPFKLNYKTPETLGIDRRAVIAYAWEQYPNKNILAIDAGTCITYDFIREDGTYLGGGISPGMEHVGTVRLSRSRGLDIQAYAAIH